MIADQLIKGQLPHEFTEDELVDLLFLLPEKEWDDIQYFSTFDQSLQTLVSSLKAKDPEALLSEVQSALASCSRLEKKADRFIFQPSKLLGSNEWTTISCDESFLQALALITTDEELVFDFHSLAPQMRQLLCWFFFLREKNPSIISAQQALSLPPTPNALQKRADHYGRETLRMSLLRYGSYEEQDLEKSFDYLKHLRNLFKVLYEQQAFDALPLNQLSGKSFRLLSEWSEIGDRFSESGEMSVSFAELLSQIQTFTREQFTRYLALSKQEKTSDAIVFSAQIFLALMVVLRPVIPEFVCRVEQLLGTIKPQLLKKSDYQAEKDYKIHLLFDILKGVHQQRAQLKLKKHLPIQLAIQANSAILQLLESYEASLKSLFKIEKMQYLTANESFPSDFHIFNILDITVGIKPYELSPQQDEQMQREKQLKEKIQALEYVRSTLMVLTLNPLTDPQKIEEKEAEMETIKNDIQHLEIKIQKAKMEKKS